MQASIRLCMVYITAPTKDVATKLSNSLLNKKLIACCNIIDNVQSHYVWEGKLEDSQEVLMILKSREELIPKIDELVQ